MGRGNGGRGNFSDHGCIVSTWGHAWAGVAAYCEQFMRALRFAFGVGLVCLVAADAANAQSRYGRRSDSPFSQLTAPFKAAFNAVTATVTGQRVRSRPRPVRVAAATPAERPAREVERLPPTRADRGSRPAEPLPPTRNTRRPKPVEPPAQAAETPARGVLPAAPPSGVAPPPVAAAPPVVAVPAPAKPSLLWPMPRRGRLLRPPRRPSVARPRVPAPRC